MGVEVAAMAAMGAGKLLDSYGQSKAQGAATARFNTAQAQGRSMMKSGADPYQQALMELLGKTGPATQVGVNAGAIDTSPILANINTGNDALSQFLRADPSKQTPFDASQAFSNLQSLDSRNQAGAVAALNANMGGGLGARFGSSAARQTSDLLANINAQTGARNANILQTSYDSAENRRMQGLGMTLSAGQALSQSGNQMAQLAAQLGMANQNNSQWNQTFNQNNLNTLFSQKMQGLQAGFGMQNANDQYNAQLFSLMNGMPMPTGNGYTAVGGGLGDIGQMMMFLPMLQQMSQKKVA